MKNNTWGIKSFFQCSGPSYIQFIKIRLNKFSDKNGTTRKIEQDLKKIWQLLRLSTDFLTHYLTILIKLFWSLRLFLWHSFILLPRRKFFFIVQLINNNTLLLFSFNFFYKFIFIHTLAILSHLLSLDIHILCSSSFKMKIIIVAYTTNL